jgi:hypothetical protein
MYEQGALAALGDRVEILLQDHFFILLGSTPLIFSENKITFLH